jgi:cephalosporin-C deacetylase-like acetyl esterase
MGVTLTLVAYLNAPVFIGPTVLNGTIHDENSNELVTYVNRLPIQKTLKYFDFQYLTQRSNAPMLIHW